MFSACLRLYTSTSKFPFRIFFLTFFSVALVEMIFFYKERWQFGKADLLQRFNDNELGEVCCLTLRVWFCRVSIVFCFFIRGRPRYCMFFANPVRHHSPRSPACVANESRGNPICLGWDGDTRSVYTSWG